MGVAAHQHALHAPDPPDTLYALAVGLYAAALLSPAVVMGIGLWVSADAGILYIGLLAAVTGIATVVTWLTTQCRGLAEQIGSTRVSWGLALLPILVAGGYLHVADAIESSAVGPGAIVGIFFGLVGMVLGTVIVGMSRTRFTAAVMDGVTVDCEVTAGWPQSQRNRFQYALVTAMLVVVGAWFVDAVSDYFAWLRAVTHLLIIPVFWLLPSGNERTYRIAAVGLERSHATARNLFAWDEFESFEVKDDAVVVHWRSWWRPAITCATSDIDDVEQVADALAAHLPRR